MKVGCVSVHLQTPCRHPRIGPQSPLSSIRRIGGFGRRSEVWFFKSLMCVYAPCVYYGAVLFAVPR